MIHLDRNHHPSPLSPHANSNLILPPNHSDQFKPLSRSPLAHDDKPIQLAAAPPNVTLDSDATHTSTAEELLVAKQCTPPVDDPLQPSPVFPLQLPTPNGQRSSSLSPPPDSGSPKSTAPSSPSVVPEEPFEDPALEVPVPAPSEVPATQEEEQTAVSPLSELSPAPELDTTSEDDKQDSVDEPTSPTEVADATIVEARVPTDAEKVATEEETEHKEEDSTKSPTSEDTLPVALPPQSPGPSAPVPDAESKTTSISDTIMSSDLTTNEDHTESKPAAVKSPSKSPARSPIPEPTSSQEARGPSRQPSVSSSSSEPVLSKDKTVRLLELNGELLKFVQHLHV